MLKIIKNLSKSRLTKVINKLKPSKGLKKENKGLIRKEKRIIKFKPMPKIKKIGKIRKIKKDVYEPIKINGSFSDNCVEYRSVSKKDKSTSIKKYLDETREYLRRMINDNRKFGEWKIQLILKINFISSKNFNDVRDMHRKSDNVEIMMGVDTNEIIEKLFDSILQRYKRKGLEESMKVSDFVFDYVESLNYIFHKIDLKRCGSDIETPKWIKKKKATINFKNKDDKCFQYSVTIALNYDEMKRNHQRLNRINKFVNRYDWSEINFPSHVGITRFELNNNSVALNVLYIPYGEKTIRDASKSKYNLKRENQVILLIISDGE